MPAAARLLLVHDRGRFRPSAVPVVVVSHTALRLLAFVLGQHPEGWAAITRRPALERALRAAHPPLHPFTHSCRKDTLSSIGYTQYSLDSNNE
jgi:hypothetical protein